MEPKKQLKYERKRYRSTQNAQNSTDIPNCKNSSDNFHHLCSFFYMPLLVLSLLVSSDVADL